jgi:5-methylcytosine-specific restriction endonuclease McrA
MSQFQQFFDSNFVYSTSSIKNAVIRALYITFNTNSTGVNKMYAFLKTLKGVSTSKDSFIGLSIKSVNVPAEQPVNVPAEQPVNVPAEQPVNVPAEQPVNVPAEQPAMSEFNKQLLALKKEKIASNERIAAHKIESDNMKIASDERIAAWKIESEKELKNMDIEEKHKDREFIREENNKNRRMYSNVNHNRCLDFKAYGTAHTQYITQESMIDIIGLAVFNSNNNINKSTLEVIESEVNARSEDINIYENEITTKVKSINAKDVTEILDKITKIVYSKYKLACNMSDITNSVDYLKYTSTRDLNRSVESNYQKSKLSQDAIKNKTEKHKTDYIRNVNKLTTKEGNKMFIRCYCCLSELELKSSACHRAHNIPKSNGGDWSKDNIYLTCATCNQDMGDEKTVLEYKTELFIKFRDLMLANSDDHIDEYENQN